MAGGPRGSPEEQEEVAGRSLSHQRTSDEVLRTAKFCGAPAKRTGCCFVAAGSEPGNEGHGAASTVGPPCADKPAIEVVHLCLPFRRQHAGNLESRVGANAALSSGNWIRTSSATASHWRPFLIALVRTLLTTQYYTAATDKKESGHVARVTGAPVRNPTRRRLVSSTNRRPGAIKIRPSPMSRPRP